MLALQSLFLWIRAGILRMPACEETKFPSLLREGNHHAGVQGGNYHA